MNEFQKVGVACSIGGMVTLAIAMAVAPAFWWLGLLAGIAAGYLGYEFKDVLRAIPVALRTCNETVASVLVDLSRWARVWFSKQHPFAYAWLALMIPLTCGSFLIVRDDISLFGMLAGSAFLGIISASALLMVLSALATLGANLWEGCSWSSSSSGFASLNIPNRHEPCTYANVLRWTTEGILLVVKFFLWDIWKYAAMFLWTLICLIHSSKRMLCGLDGALGGGLVYVYMVPSGAEATLVSAVTLTLFGGLMGAVIGVAHYALSKDQFVRSGA